MVASAPSRNSSRDTGSFCLFGVVSSVRHNGNEFVVASMGSRDVGATVRLLGGLETPSNLPLKRAEGSRCSPLGR